MKQKEIKRKKREKEKKRDEKRKRGEIWICVAPVDGEQIRP